MAQDKKSKSKVKIVLIILGVVVALAISYVTLGLATQSARREKAQQATAQYEKASVEVIKAGLDLHYVLYGTYPSGTDVLLADMQENKDGIWPKEADPNALKESLGVLKDLDYSKRGDSRAYRITFTDVYGNQVSTEGNYSQDYQ